MSSEAHSVNADDPVARVEGLAKYFVLGDGPRRQSWWRRAARELFGSAAAPRIVADKGRQRQETSHDAAGIWALRRVDLTLERGKIYGLVGASGAGKTTLLRAIAGVSRPTAGRIVRRGRVTTVLELGATFESSLTGRENVMVLAAACGIAPEQARGAMDEIVAFAELERFIDVRVLKYSSGMEMRLALAAALALDPDILLADEAFAVGDIAFRQQCLERIRRNAQAGMVALIVSHDMNLVYELCDEAIWLRKGVVHDKGIPAKIIPAFEKSLLSVNNDLIAESSEARCRIGRILSIGIHSQENVALNVVDTSQAMIFRIVFAIDVAVDRIRGGLALYCKKRLVSLGEEHFEQRREAGTYRVEADFPAGMLGQNHYTVNVSIQFVRDQQSYLIKMRDAFEFKGLQGRPLSSSKPIVLISRSAMVDPQLIWKLEPAVASAFEAPASTSPG